MNKSSKLKTILYVICVLAIVAVICIVMYNLNKKEAISDGYELSESQKERLTEAPGDGNAAWNNADESLETLKGYIDETGKFSTTQVRRESRDVVTGDLTHDDVVIAIPFTDNYDGVIYFISNNENNTIDYNFRKAQESYFDGDETLKNKVETFTAVDNNGNLIYENNEDFVQDDPDTTPYSSGDIKANTEKISYSDIIYYNTNKELYDEICNEDNIVIIKNITTGYYNVATKFNNYIVSGLNIQSEEDIESFRYFANSLGMNLGTEFEKIEATNNIENTLKYSESNLDYETIYNLLNNYGFAIGQINRERVIINSGVNIEQEKYNSAITWAVDKNEIQQYKKETDTKLKNNATTIYFDSQEEFETNYAITGDQESVSYLVAKFSGEANVNELINTVGEQSLFNSIMNEYFKTHKTLRGASDD